MLKLLRLAAWLLGCLGLLLADGSSHAQPAGCTLINVQSIRFGQYRSRDFEPLDTAGTIMYRCPGASQVRLEIGRGNSGSFQRSMRVRDSVMHYNLYLDAGHSRIWGDGTNGTSVYTARPDGNATTRVSVFGRIPPRQAVRSGYYEDQLILTMLF